MAADETRSLLTARQREALALVREHGITYHGDPGGNRAPVTAGVTFLDGGIPWINYRTAQALENRGLGRIEGYGDETEFVLAERVPSL